MTTFDTDNNTGEHPGATPNSPADRNRQSTVLSGVVATLFAGAIFGFFYAWVCSTMWGLDDTDPRVAIEAMQAMNASVRNPVFFPAFFLTPVALLIAAGFARRTRSITAAKLFAAAAAVYLLGGMLLTGAINVPMNNELADVVVPGSVEEASIVWDDYSGEWQMWNIVRTIFSGVSLALASFGLITLHPRSR